MNIADFYRRSCVSAAALGLGLGIAAVGVLPAAAQTFTYFPINTPDGAPSSIVAGPDGNLWFTEPGGPIEFGDAFGNRIGKITTAGVVTEVVIPTDNSSPQSITVGPDGALWFTEQGSPSDQAAPQKIGRITTAGVITNEFDVPVTPLVSAHPYIITLGPDGALWFTEFSTAKIGRITTAGTVTETTLPTFFPSGSHPIGITVGPDNNLWFTENSSNKIGRITPAGVATEFAVTTANSEPTLITNGPDGNLWFTEASGNKIGKMSTAGVMLGEFAVPTANATPWGITTGPDGNLWFTEIDGNKLGRITTAGVISEFALTAGATNPVAITTGPDGNLWFAADSGHIGRFGVPAGAANVLAAVLPSSRSVQVSKFGTAFASIINNTDATATGCGIAPVGAVPANFTFQTTDPATNTLIGTQNTRVSIAAHGTQTFLMSFQANGAFPSTQVQLGFACNGLPAAGSITGVNTSCQLTFDPNPVPDMIAVGDTTTHNGISHIPGVGSTGIFVIAATNIGASKQLTVRARLLDPSTQATATVCETNSSGPQIGQCKGTAAASVVRTIATNENTTWTAFITAQGTVPLDPAKHRVVFQFEDGNAIRGSTSVAVTTQ